MINVELSRFDAGSAVALADRRKKSLVAAAETLMAAQMKTTRRGDMLDNTMSTNKTRQKRRKTRVEVEITGTSKLWAQRAHERRHGKRYKGSISA
jgi:hypothetical protein